VGYLSSGPSGFRSLGCERLIVSTLQFVLLELACGRLVVQVQSATNISITWGNTLSATIYLCFSCYCLLTLSATIYLVFVVAIVHLLFSKEFQLQKVFSKLFVGILELASLWVDTCKGKTAYIRISSDPAWAGPYWEVVVVVVLHIIHFDVWKAPQDSNKFFNIMLSLSIIFLVSLGCIPWKVNLKSLQFLFNFKKWLKFNLIGRSKFSTWRWFRIS